jgi:hypothetical protein
VVEFGKSCARRQLLFADGQLHLLAAGIEIPPPAKKTIDLEGRLIKEGVRKALNDRQRALTDLIHAIREYRKAGEQPLTLRGSDYAHSVQELNKAIDRAQGLLQ